MKGRLLVAAVATIAVVALVGGGAYVYFFSGLRSSPSALGLVPRALFPRPKKPVGLSEPIAVTTRFGRLLDLPEHPNKGNAQTDDDGQKYQRQARGCEHGEHP